MDINKLLFDENESISQEDLRYLEEIGCSPLKQKESILPKISELLSEILDSLGDELYEEENQESLADLMQFCFNSGIFKYTPSAS